LYALDCYKNFNVIKATYKTLWRIFRCNPWFDTGGIDNISEEENK
tara:strand:+ start:5624 stop:5758 length:135 start_codon:yes stop_codon:yes gene_type:complete